MSDNLDRRLVEILWKFHNDRLKDPSIKEMKPYVDELRAEVDKARSIPDPDRYSRRLKRLKRRRDWLKSQSDSTPDRTDIGYTRAELSALNWAIEILEGLNPHLNTQESEDTNE